MQLLPKKEVEKEQTAVDETPKADTSNSSKANINDRKKNIKKSSNVQSIPPTIKDKTLDVIKAFSNNYFDEQWVKEGYYIVFGEIKIKLEKFENNNTIAVLSTCQTATSNNCAALESNIRVAVDKNYKFNFNGYVYKIVLQKIDHAGKDPNTLAAYISLIKEL